MFTQEDYLKYKIYIDKDPDIIRYRAAEAEVRAFNVQEYMPKNENLNAKIQQWSVSNQKAIDKQEDIKKKIEAYHKLQKENVELSKELQQLQSQKPPPDPENEIFISGNQVVAAKLDNCFQTENILRQLKSDFGRECERFNKQTKPQNPIKFAEEVKAAEEIVCKTFTREVINEITNHKFELIDIQEPEDDFRQAFITFILSNWDRPFEIKLFKYFNGKTLPNIDQMPRINNIQAETFVSEDFKNRWSSGEYLIRIIFCIMLLDRTLYLKEIPEWKPE